MTMWTRHISRGPRTSRRGPLRSLRSAIVLAWLAASPAAAGAQADGGTQSPFSAIGAGSRGISLGKAYVSLADDASALYWNPAALRNVQTRQVMVMYMPLYGGFTDAKYTFLGVSYPTLNAGALGIAFMRLGTSFEAFDEGSVPLGSQDYSETQILVGYAAKRRFGYLYGDLSAGLNFKIANQKVGSFSSTAPGVDLGFIYYPEFAREIAFGLNFQDLVGPSHKLVSESDKTFRTVQAGLGYTRVLGNGSAVRVMLEMDFPEKADSKFKAGAEYSFTRYVSLRLGYDGDGVTFGLGANVRGFGFDYAFVNRETAGSSHPVTFSADWGPLLAEQRAVISREQADREQELIREEFRQRVKRHRDLAKRHEAEGKLLIAVDELKIVLEYVPGDPEATERMEALSRILLDEQAREVRDREKQIKISDHFSKGLKFYQRNEYARSREEWLAILVVDSTHAEARDYLGRTQSKIDELLVVHTSRARTLEDRGRFIEAVGEWNYVQVLDPGNAEAAAAIERLQVKIEAQSADFEQATKQLRIVNLYTTALQDYAQGRYEAAMAGLEQLLDLEPAHEDARKLLAMATRKLTPLTRTEEDAIRIHFLRGMEHFSKDRYAEAISAWEKILEIDPTNESVQKNIEEARERLRQLETR